MAMIRPEADQMGLLGRNEGLYQEESHRLQLEKNSITIEEPLIYSFDFSNFQLRASPRRAKIDFREGRTTDRNMLVTHSGHNG